MTLVQSYQQLEEDSAMADQKVAVLIPCHNEEASVAKVIQDFKSSLPEADIFVYDNNSTDQTVARACKAGARIMSEPLQGKGHVMRRMFADIEADIYIMVDGDDTYDAGAAVEMVNLLRNKQLDMVIGVRVEDNEAAYPFGHQWGNRFFNALIANIFGSRVQDIFSGYRVLSRRFVKSFPALSKGFEIETEMTVHALEMKMPLAEYPSRYGARPEESESKLNTIADGLRILKMVARLTRDERPLEFFGSFFILFEILALILGVPVVLEFMETGLVPRLPTAVLATGMAICGLILLACGLILITVSKHRMEAKRLAYLRLPAVGNGKGSDG